MTSSITESPSTTAKVVAALLVGLVVLLFLFPASGVDTLPPHCFSIFNYEVPCDAWVSWAGAIPAAAAVGLLLRVVSRRR